MAEEVEFLKREGILVTSSRLVISGKTYALGSITSFRRHTQEIRQTSKPMLVFWGVLSFFLLVPVGLALLVGGSRVPGALFILLAAVAIYGVAKSHREWQRKIESTIYLSVASGEVAAYKSRDGDLAKAIEKSLTKALIHRG